MKQKSPGFSRNPLRLSRLWRSRSWRLKDHVTSLAHRYLFPSVLLEGSPLLKEDYPARDRLVRFGRWFIHMRWIACVAAAGLIFLTIEVLHYLEKASFWPLVIEVACLVATNILFSLLLRRGWLIRPLLELQIYTDLVILTAMLHCSGGLENPLSFVYLFHIIISGILLDRRKCYVIVVVASALFSAMAFVEMGGLLKHSTLLVFPHPLVGEEESLFHAAHEPLYVTSRVILQFILLSLTAYFTTTIMERLRSEEQRALADRQRLERVVQATGAGLTVLDKDLRLVWFNDQIQSWLELSKEMIGQAPPQLEQWMGGKNGPAIETLQDGMVRVVERELTDAQGNKRFFQVTVAPLTDSTGNVYQIVELAQDITEHKMLEAEMMHAGKMAVLGFMAAGIAHEVGNPLASISTRLRLLQEQHDETFLKESLHLLQAQIDRIGRIVRGVSQFARPGKNEWSACQINTIVGEALNVLRLHRLAKSSQIGAELAQELPETMGVKDQLIQVFLNLGLNALEAMPHGGVLTVKTYIEEGDIGIGFADTGEGMDDEIRSKIFDPFFSTKESGLGIGLCIAHNIINAHGGRIEVEHDQGEGAVFTVILPIRTPGRRAYNEMRVVSSK